MYTRDRNIYIVGIIMVVWGDKIMTCIVRKEDKIYIGRIRKGCGTRGVVKPRNMIYLVKECPGGAGKVELGQLVLPREYVGKRVRFLIEEVV
jgi:hypothetical protein